MAGPLGAVEQMNFEEIISGERMALMRVTYDGEETAVIARVTQDENGTFFVEPLAVLLTGAMMGRLADSDGRPLS